MNDTHNDRFEAMLTAWGDSCAAQPTEQCLTISRAAAVAASGPADEAEADHVRICPICARLVGRLEGRTAEAADRPIPFPTGRARRWVPLAAAVLIAAAGIGVITTMLFRAQADAVALADARADAEDLRTRLGAVTATTERLIDERTQTREQVATLRKELAKVPGREGTFRAEMERRLTALAAEARAEAERKDGQLDALRADLRTAREKLTAETTLAARQQAEAARIRDGLSRQVARLEARQAERLTAVQATWKMFRGSNSLLQVGPDVLAQMQSAARSANLAARAAVLAASEKEKGTVGLLNRLEVIFVRLDLADPNDRLDQRWLAAVVAADVIDAVDAALTGEAADGPNVSDELRTFLNQAQVVLLRGACAT